MGPDDGRKADMPDRQPQRGTGGRGDYEHLAQPCSAALVKRRRTLGEGGASPESHAERSHRRDERGDARVAVAVGAQRTHGC